VILAHQPITQRGRDADLAARRCVVADEVDRGSRRRGDAEPEDLLTVDRIQVQRGVDDVTDPGDVAVAFVQEVERGTQDVPLVALQGCSGRTEGPHRVTDVEHQEAEGLELFGCDAAAALGSAAKHVVGDDTGCEPTGGHPALTCRTRPIGATVQVHGPAN